MASKRLMEADPPIQIGRVTVTGDRGILIAVHTLSEGEERTIAERLRTMLR